MKLFKVIFFSLLMMHDAMPHIKKFNFVFCIDKNNMNFPFKYKSFAIEKNQINMDPQIQEIYNQSENIEMVEEYVKFDHSNVLSKYCDE